MSCLAAAGFFALAVAYAAHPDIGAALSRGARGPGSVFDRQGWGPAVTIDIEPPAPTPAPPADGASASVRIAILPDLASARLRARPPLPLQASARDHATARAIAVSERLKDNLAPDLRTAFDLFVYVSKAESGPLAQRMYVFRKRADGSLLLLHDWPASTGRERQEVSARGQRTFTGTPRGYYELDPDRMYRRYRSRSWDQPMPYAMFFNWERRGRRTGLAIHAASGDDIARLGRRASAGCVHLSPRNARTLYELIRAEYRGRVPRFAYDARSRTMSNDGTLMRGAGGKPTFADGYKVLVLIENYAGDDSVARLF